MLQLHRDKLNPTKIRANTYIGIGMVEDSGKIQKDGYYTYSTIEKKIQSKVSVYYFLKIFFMSSTITLSIKMTAYYFNYYFV